MSHYPISLDLQNRKCVVVGGGSIAERKVDTLLECGAAVTVIAPDVTPHLAELASAGSIAHIAERYTHGMLDGSVLVIAATDDREINRQVSAEAQEAGIPVNVVDDPELCTFYVPAAIRRGDITISISTSGKSPSLARRIREELEDRFGPEYGELAEIMGDLRDEVKAAHSTMADRQKAYARILDSDVLELIRQGRREEAIERARKCIL